MLFEELNKTYQLEIALFCFFVFINILAFIYIKKYRYKVRESFWFVISFLPFLKIFSETRRTQTPITFSIWFLQKIIGFNRKAYWPVHFTSRVYKPQNVLCGIETCPGYSPGCYIQADGKIFIGDYTQIAPNVALITSNHDLHDNRISSQKTTIDIGKYCWLGFGSVILPSVKLGDYTIVAANSVVTKSFEEGFCVVAGNPAKIIKYLDKDQCVFHDSEKKYNGYIQSSKFKNYRKKKLNV